MYLKGDRNVDLVIENNCFVKKVQFTISANPVCIKSESPSDGRCYNIILASNECCDVPLKGNYICAHAWIFFKLCILIIHCIQFIESDS